MLGKTNAVITFAKGKVFKDDGFWVYVNSVRRNIKEAKHVILTNDIPDDVCTKLKDQGVRVKEVKPVSYIFRDRHLAYWNHLLDYGHLYDRVMITDCRDVVFQSNPFMWLEDWKDRFNHIKGSKDFLNHFVILTTEGFKMSRSGFACIENFEFQRNVHKEFHTETSDQYVINGGVSFGTPLALQNYHFLIWSLMAKTFGACTDQAAINWAYQFLKEDETYSVSSPVRDFLCLTGEGVKEKVVSPIFENGVLKNPQDKLYSIIHQWDRLDEDIQKCILRRFL